MKETMNQTGVFRCRAYFIVEVTPLFYAFEFFQRLKIASMCINLQDPQNSTSVETEDCALIISVPDIHHVYVRQVYYLANYDKLSVSYKE